MPQITDLRFEPVIRAAAWQPIEQALKWPTTSVLLMRRTDDLGDKIHYAYGTIDASSLAEAAEVGFHKECVFILIDTQPIKDKYEKKNS